MGVSIALQLGMYLTPVVYPLSLVESASESVGPLIGNITILDIYQLNPMEVFLSAFRSLLYDNTWPSVNDTVSCVIWAAVSLVAGWLIFRRNERSLAEVL